LLDIHNNPAIVSKIYNNNDLNAFSAACKVPQGVDHDAGAARSDDKKSGVEAALDIEYIKAVAPAVPLTDVYALLSSFLEL